MTKPRPRGLLAVVPPYTISGPPAGIAYLLGTLKEKGIDDFGFVDLRLGGPDWPSLTYAAVGRSGEHFVFDVPDLPLILHFLQRYPASNIWSDFERLPWVRSYCRARALSPEVLGTSLRRTDAWLARWASTLESPVIVGFSTWISNYLSTLMAAGELKRLPAPPYVVFGGPQCTDSEVAADLALACGLADAVVVGEGEQTLFELQARIDPVRRTLEGEVPAGAKVWRNGTVHRGSHRTLMRLDDAPLPDFGAMDLDVYSDKARQISFQLSRGCTDRCEFCSEWVFWERFRSTSPTAAVDGLADLQRRTGFGHVTFSDSLLNGSGKRLVSFAEQVLSRNLQFSWSGFVRADITAPVAKLLARAGLRHVFIGVESFSDETLRIINKRRDEADNLRAIEAFIGAGISVAAGVIAGFPGDTRRNFDHTANSLRRLIKRHPSKFLVSVEPFVVTPSAAIFKNRRRFGLSLLPWDDETLGKVPAVADVTRRCMARAEGDDQAAERKRRFRDARRRLQPVAPDRKPISACVLAARDALRTIPLDDKWTLAVGPDEATREAWLLTTDEVREVVLTCDAVQGRVGPMQIRWKHPLAPGAGARGVTFDLVDRFGLHPAVVARRCDSSQRLIVMNVDTELLYRMAGPTAALAEFLSADTRSMDEIVTLQESTGLSEPQLRGIVAEWWSKRLLMGVPRRLATPAAH